MIATVGSIKAMNLLHVDLSQSSEVIDKIMFQSGMTKQRQTVG